MSREQFNRFADWLFCAGLVLVAVLAVLSMAHNLKPVNDSGDESPPVFLPEPQVVVQTVTVEKPVFVEVPAEPVVVIITAEELDLLERLVSAEARGETYEGQVAVANVVLNRVYSDKWPDSITDVILEKGQFEPVSNGAITNQATDSAKCAVLDALKGRQVVPYTVDCFAHKSIDFSSWAERDQQIGNHVFWVSFDL